MYAFRYREPIALRYSQIPWPMNRTKLIRPNTHDAERRTGTSRRRQSGVFRKTRKYMPHIEDGNWDRQYVHSREYFLLSCSGATCSNMSTVTPRSTILFLAACTAYLCGCSQPPQHAGPSNSDAATDTTPGPSDAGIGVDAGCSDACSMNATRCRDNFIQTCTTQANGCLDWSDTHDCADSLEVCSDFSGSALCGADCNSDMDCFVEGEAQCSGSVVQNCSPDGNSCLAWTDAFDCGAGFDCVEGGLYPTCVCGVITDLAVTTTGTDGATGSVSTEDLAIDCGADCSETYTCDRILLSAIPDPGFRFESWSGDCEFDCPCELSMVEDRNVSASFGPARLNWARSFIGGDYYPAGIVTLPDGDIVVAGHFRDNIILGNDIIVAAANSDIYAARFTATGEHVWHRALVGTGYNEALTVAADSVGNVLIGGVFSDDLDFGDGSVTANMSDAFVAKYAAADGAHMWSQVLTGPSAAQLRGLAVDGADDVVITGKFGVSVDIGGTVHSTVDSNGFLAKLAGADGSRVWSQDFGDVGIKFGDAISLTASADLLVAGTVLGDLDLGCGLLPAPASSLPVTGSSLDVFVSKFNGGTGLCEWSKRWEGVSYDVVEAIATTPDDGFVIAGSFHETIQFGSVFTSVDSADGFVASFSSDGTHRWSRQIAGDLQQMPRDIVIDSQGNVLVAGEHKQQTEFGGITKCSVDDRFNAFVSKYDSLGTNLWVRDYGDDWSYGEGITTDADDNVLLVGHFEDTIEFGAGPLTATGRNMFIVSMEP